MYHPGKITITLTLAFSLAIFGGCGVQPTKKPEPTAQTAEEELETLLQKAEDASGLQEFNYRLDAIQLLVQMEQFEEAADLFVLLQTEPIPKPLETEYRLTGADLYLKQLKSQQALTLLSKPDRLPKGASKEQRIQFAQLSAQALDLEGWPLEGALKLIGITHLLSQAAASENKESLWYMLMKTPTEELADRLTQTESKQIAGWLSLAYLAKRYQNDLDRQLEELNSWQTGWSQHPAAINLPEELKILGTMVTERPKHISLLLPLTGTNASAGRAIRDGFLAAHYAALAQGSPTPRIDLIDTSQSAHFPELYSRITASGTELIIGPLEKGLMQTLERQQLSVPTLALNYGYDPQGTANLFQFGLSAEDEARQAAQQAWRAGHRRALVLSAESDWGRRTAQAFEDEWRTLSGTLLETQLYGDEKSFSMTIQEMLNIDESVRRAQRLQSLTSHKLEFTPRRRQDADFIFLAASPKQARQIKPTLAFHFAGSLPVYATSQIFSGVNAQQLDRDLDGIQFCETPWMLNTADPELKRTILATWPNAPTLGRLYALGADAYRLYPRIQQLARIRRAHYQGLTGMLSVDEQGRILRELHWATFEKGQVQQIH